MLWLLLFILILLIFITPGSSCVRPYGNPITPYTLPKVRKSHKPHKESE